MDTEARTALLDARWLGMGGVGTFTRSLLHGLAEVEPGDRWVVWGPAAAGEIRWPGAVHVPCSTSPTAWLGQRSALRMPPADVVLHPHQTRPVHPRPAAVCVLDLIQLQHPSLTVRAGKALRLRLSISSAAALFTISPSVRDELVARFGLDEASIGVLHLPVDADAARRIAARRAVVPPARVVLAVGRFTPHKNHRRLVEAFARTRFAATGGQLHLLGGPAGGLELGSDPLPPGLRILGELDATGLEDAMARALALVQPSLVEGYGLPVAEALLAGVPVTSSPVPAVTDFGPPGIPVFDPTSVPAMADAIDETVDLVDAGRYWERVDRDSWASVQPTPAALARQVVDGLRRAQLL
jgi:glycosyltransferase involved in cell wall biosynthesis